MEEQRVSEIKQRCDRTTPGPWVRWVEHSEVFYQGEGDDHENEPGIMSGNRIAECDPSDLPDFDGDMADDEDAYQIQAEHNADFIAHARTDIPDLLAALSEAEGLVREMAKALRSTAPFLEHKLVDYCVGCEVAALLDRPSVAAILARGEKR